MSLPTRWMAVIRSTVDGSGAVANAQAGPSDNAWPSVAMTFQRCFTPCCKFVTVSEVALKPFVTGMKTASWLGTNGQMERLYTKACPSGLVHCHERVTEEPSPFVPSNGLTSVG